MFLRDLGHVAPVAIPLGRFFFWCVAPVVVGFMQPTRLHKIAVFGPRDGLSSVLRQLRTSQVVRRASCKGNLIRVAPSVTI